MNQKKKIENYQQIAMGTGLRYDEVGGLFHGERDGFDFIVYAPDARYPYMMVLHTAAKSADGSTFDKQAVKGFQKSSKKIASFGQKNLDIRVSLKAQSNAEKCKDTLNEALAATTTFLRGLPAWTDSLPRHDKECRTWAHVPPGHSFFPSV